MAQGGILLVLASYHSTLATQDVCTGPLALLSSVLGPSRLAGCACGSVGRNDTIARLDAQAASDVFGGQQAILLAGAQVN